MLLVASRSLLSGSSFFFNDPATTQSYTLSLHDALPIYSAACAKAWMRRDRLTRCSCQEGPTWQRVSPRRSEEHTSELQSLRHLVCRLLLEKKKQRLKRLYLLHHSLI